MKTIFLDSASTTKPIPEVLSVIAKAHEENFYNPGALYAQGFLCKQKLEDARSSILNLFGATGYGMVFCSSATEANNLALFQAKQKQTILIGAGEHPAIYETAQSLKNLGHNVVFIPLAKDGKVDEAEFRRLMTKEVGFISIMHVSNETGAINNIKDMCDYAKKVNPKVIFHSDGVQAFTKIEGGLSYLGVDLYTVSSHKICGPKGVGALFFKKGLNLKPQTFGGGQEFGIRSGTENLPLVLGFAKAVQIKIEHQSQNFLNVLNQKQSLIEALKKEKVDFEINGNAKEDSPYILSTSFLGVRGEVLLHSLESYGVLVSTGSACSTKKIGNRILSAMQKSQTEIEGNIRFSFSPEQEFDALFVANAIKIEINKLKRIR